MRFSGTAPGGENADPAPIVSGLRFNDFVPWRALHHRHPEPQSADILSQKTGAHDDPAACQQETTRRQIRSQQCLFFCQCRAGDATN
jgi:hypothetical protein